MRNVLFSHIVDITLQCHTILFGRDQIVTIFCYLLTKCSLDSLHYTHFG